MNQHVHIAVCLFLYMLHFIIKWRVNYIIIVLRLICNY